MYVVHPALQLLGEVATGEVDVLQGRVGVPVPGEGRDGVQLPAHPRQIGQAQMAGGVGGEPLDASRQGETAYHLRPGPQSQWLAMVAPGLRQEQWPPGPADRRAMREVVGQQHACGRGVRHHAFQPVLRRLRTHPQRPVRRIQVIGAQRAQLLPAQRRIVGERQHHPVTHRFTPCHLQQVKPLPLGRDPGQLGEARHQASLLVAPASARRVPSAAHGVRLTQAFLDEEAVEQSYRH